MKIRQLVVSMGLGFAALGAQAQVTQNLAVSASITGSCSLVVNPLAFSSYDPASVTPNNAQTTVVLTCSTGAGASLALGPGLNSTGPAATAQRRMRVGATTSFLNYNIYQPSGTAPGDACAFTTAWGAGPTVVGPVLAIGVAPSGAARTYNVCGQIPALQAAAVGSYVDTVVVTANL